MVLHYCLFDCETSKYVKHTASRSEQECLFKSINWLTEDWGVEQWNQAFADHKTFKGLLIKYNFLIDQKIGQIKPCQN